MVCSPQARYRPSSSQGTLTRLLTGQKRAPPRLLWPWLLRGGRQASASAVSSLGCGPSEPLPWPLQLPRRRARRLQRSALPPAARRPAPLVALASQALRLRLRPLQPRAASLYPLQVVRARLHLRQRPPSRTAHLRAQAQAQPQSQAQAEAAAPPKPGRHCSRAGQSSWQPSQQQLQPSRQRLPLLLPVLALLRSHQRLLLLVQLPVALLPLRPLLPGWLRSAKLRCE